MIDIPVTSATVPSPLDCVVSNENWQALVSLLQATFPEDASIINTGNSEPSPSRRAYPWYRYNADGSPDKWYRYSMGAWLSLHPVAPDTVVMYEGTEVSIPTFDGGEAGAVTAISGPMWEKVTSMNARFPVGPGTLPSTTVIGIGDTGGEEKVSLTVPHMPPHTHSFRVNNNDDGGGGSGSDVPDDSDTTVGGNLFGETESTGGSGTPAAVEGHNNLPPFLGIWFIRRTARTHYRL